MKKIVLILLVFILIMRQPTYALRPMAASTFISREFQEAAGDIHAHLPRNIGPGEVEEIIADMDRRLKNSTGANFKVAKTETRVRDTDVIHYKLPYGGPMTVIGYGKEKSRRYTLVDTGMGVYYQDMKKQLVQDGIMPEHIERILILHYDMDHAAAAGYFQRDFPKIKIYAHKSWHSTVRNRQPKDPAGAAYSAIVRKLFDYIHPPGKLIHYGERIGEIRIGEVVLGKDHSQMLPVLGKPFVCGDISLTVIKSATHTLDYVYIVDMDNGLLFAGEPIQKPTQTSNEAAMLAHMQALHKHDTVHYSRIGFKRHNKAFESDGRFTKRFCGHDEPIVDDRNRQRGQYGDTLLEDAQLAQKIEASA